MKKYILLSLIISFSSSILMAQQVENKSEKTSKTIELDSCGSNSKGLQLEIQPAFFWGLNGYTHKGSTSLPKNMQNMELDYSKSKNFAAEFLIQGLKTKNDALYVTTGLGIEWSGYRFKENISISTNSDSTVFTLDSNKTYSKYKLRSTYLNVPVLIGFNIGEDDDDHHHFEVQAGIIAGIKVGSRIKTKSGVEGPNKDEIIDDFNLNPFKLTATARVGFDNIGIYANYSLTSLFEENKAAKLSPFSVGLVANF